LLKRKVRFLQAMNTPEESLNANGGSTGVSHETHERPAQERHSVENDNVISLPLRANGQERASAERHAVENDQDPLQSPYAPKKESAQPAVEGDFAISADAALLASEGLLEHLERRPRDANGDQQELERLAASVRVEHHAVENDHGPPQSPKKETSQLAVEGGFAVSEDAAPHASEGSREHLERRAHDVHDPSLFSRDANGDQQQLERLVANIHAVEREEAAARLPRAAQLRSVPGLAPADSGFGPPRSLDLVPSPAMGSRPDGLRGPFTIIKISTLIVSMFAVPAAYYFWVGGWDPISMTRPERGSFDSNFIVPQPKPLSRAATAVGRNDDPGTSAKGEPRTAKSFVSETVATQQPDTPGAQDSPSSTAVRPLVSSGAQDPPSGTAVLPLVSNSMVPPPMPSSQAATTIARDDDPGTPAKGEPRTAKSFVGETVATQQPDTPGAQDSPSSTAVRPLDPEQIKLLMKQGEQFIAAGDMVTARLPFQRAAEAGDANAAAALGATYDPTVLARFGVVGISADVAEARSWYRKAEKLGSLEARQRLEALADR
jgi:hypothetical protein